MQGRLVNAIAQVTSTLALLIVDEADRAIGPNKLWDGPRTVNNRVPRDRIRTAQLAVIAACAQKSATVVKIRFLSGMSNEVEVEPGATGFPRVFNFRKGEANAFQMPGSGGEELQTVLKSAGVNTLVVMGYHVNACVLTTIGVNKLTQAIVDCNKEYWGAVQYGYRVLTCKQVLHGAEIADAERDAIWNYDKVLLEFYTQV